MERKEDFLPGGRFLPGGGEMKQHESIHISYDFTLLIISHWNKVFLK